MSITYARPRKYRIILKLIRISILYKDQTFSKPYRNGYTKTMDISYLASATYIVLISSENGSIIKKLIKE